MSRVSQCGSSGRATLHCTLYTRVSLYSSRMYIHCTSVTLNIIPVYNECTVYTVYNACTLCTPVCAYVCARVCVRVGVCDTLVSPTSRVQFRGDSVS